MLWGLLGAVQQAQEDSPEGRWHWFTHWRCQWALSLYVEGKRTNQTIHHTAPKFMKHFLGEFPCESQVCQRWDTSANRLMVWTEEAVGDALRTRMAFGGHYSWQSCYVAQMSSDFQMLSLRSPTYLYSYPHDSPLCSSPLGYWEEKLHRGDREGWKNGHIWMDRLFRSKTRAVGH